MRILFVEDNPRDVELTVAELRRFGFELAWERVETLEALGLALEERSWSLIICGYALPGFTGREVVELVRDRESDLPVIVVSGTLGEEDAVDIIRAGAKDYVSKHRLARLGPAVERELRDVQLREERRALFTALRRSEDRHRRIFENAPVGVAVSTPDGTLLAVNERFAGIIGQRPEQISGRKMSDFTTGVHVAPGQPDRSERRFVRADGAVVWTAVSVAPITTDSLEVEQLVWLVEDITAQKQRDAELRIHRAQLDEAQRMAQMGSYELDLTTGRRVWSSGLFRIFGYTDDLQPELALLDQRVHPDDRDHVHSVRRQILSSSEAYIHEYRIVLPGGEVRTVQDRGSFVRGEDGRALKIVGIVQDVTDVRMHERELQRRNVQQVVLANLGQAALAGEPIESLISQIAQAVTGLMQVDVATIMQQDGTAFRVVGHSGWDGLLVNGRVLDATTAAHSTYAVQSGGPVIVSDLRNETRFTPSPFLLENGVISGITVPVSIARTAPWGILSALARTARDFPQSDVDFLRSVATVLAQALERDRTERQLVLHAAQQSAIAELSRVALKSVDEAIEVACAIVNDVLEVEHALFFEFDQPSQVLRYRAGRSWAPAGEMNIHPGSDSGVLDAVQRDVPVTLLPDERYGIAGGVAVPVASSTGRFGALSAYSKRARTFTDADIEFLQSLANIVADAMERERARTALAVSEERHREVVEGASEVIFTVSIDGVLTSLNAAFTNITGWPATDWIGRRFLELMHPDDGERAAELFSTVIAQQESINAQLRVLGRHGVLVLDVASFPKVEDGRTAAVYGFARDVTETRRADRERQRVTRNLQLLLESTVEGIITVDLAGHCTMSNRAAAEMLGRAQHEMPGATLQTLLSGDERAVLDEIAEVARSGAVRSMNSGTFWRADGRPFPVEYSAAPIIDAGVRIGVVVSFSDITARLKLETKLEQADRLSSLGRLAATIAHEFNNVLMGIAPFVEVIRRGRNVDTSLDHISRAVKRGKRITQDILRFTQPAQPARTAIDVAPWFENVILEARSLLPQGCSIHSRIEPGLSIDGDPSQLQQIFTNLILNARDAMTDGGTLSIEVRREQGKVPFAVERPERFAHIVVRDTGAGMSDEIQRHIFEPLFTTKKNGTGLGLPVTHQVVQRHGGDIFVESTLGIGTTFHIFLPLAAHGARAAEPTAELTSLEGAHRVLLVEDDSTVAMGLVTLLELQGLHVDVALTGEEALDRVESLAPDVVILDVGLPDMDGTQVFTLLSERHPDLPIVFSTGHADRARLDTYLERPHVSCLLKPYESSSLLTAIRDVMIPV
jgi:PAS domain S-box-containing protein